MAVIDGRSSLIGEGAEQLSIPQRQQLAAEMADVMKCFGYEGVEDDV